MVLNESTSAFSELTAICAALIDVVIEATTQKVYPEACICTFFPDRTSQHITSVPYSRQRESSKAMKDIFESADLKEVTEDLKNRHTNNSETAQGTFQAYFKQNKTDLKSAEEIFLIENGYSIATGRYLALPFPSGNNFTGIFFIFANDEKEFLIVQNSLSKIANKMETLFEK